MVIVAVPIRFVSIRPDLIVAIVFPATITLDRVQDLTSNTATAPSASSTTNALTKWTTIAIRRWPHASIHPAPISVPVVRVTEETESNANVI